MPSAQQVSDWNRRVRAVTQPLEALGDISFSPATSALEAAALRATHPRLYEEYRQGVLDQAPQLATERGHAYLYHLGRVLQLPLTPENVPGYGLEMGLPPAQPQQGPDLRFAMPSNANNSPQVKAEQGAERRQGRRL